MYPTVGSTSYRALQNILELYYVYNGFYFAAARSVTSGFNGLAT